MAELRVWVEELEDDRSRFTWSWLDPVGDISLEDEQRAVIDALLETGGVDHLQAVSEGIECAVDDALISRKEIAVIIRDVLEADVPVPPDPADIRVWAEDLPQGRVRLTWQLPETFGERYEPADRRAVRARLSASNGVRSVSSDDDGVTFTHDPEVATRSELAEAVRRSLAQQDDLRTRADAMLRRSPAYANLAKTLALDDRVSPIPDAARKMQAGSRSVAPSFAMRMLPGYTTIRRIQMTLPVIQSLRTWSREAPPEVVDSHLDKAGLTREQLAEDYITSLEVRLVAQEIGAEKAGQLSRSAADAAARALDYGKALVDKQRQSDPS